MKRENKIMSKVSFFAAAAALGFSTAAPVFADGGQYDSKGSVEFTPSTTPTAPVDPLNPDPDKPILPSNPDGSTPDTGTAGPLSLDFASSLDFGVQQITSSTVDYNASAQKYTDKDGKNETNGPDFVQLTDNRGSFAGWTLSVKQAGQFATASGQELDGAAVSFGSAQHVAANGTTDGVSTTASFTLDPTAGAIPVMSGEAATTGTNGTSGTHLLRFGDASALSTTDVNGDGTARGTTDTAIKLNVPGKTAKLAAKYATTFNWILADAPSAVTVVK
jgi:hypothetical protein